MSLSFTYEQLKNFRVEDTTKKSGFVQFLAKFNRKEYSIRNKAVVFEQDAEATEVRGFKAWLKEGRIVKKGQRGIKIFAMKISEKETKEGDKEQKKYFGVQTVFDIRQTDVLPPKK